MSKNILYYGGCWPTNIGNAFIDYGAIQALKMAFPDASVHFSSEFPKWMYQQKGVQANALSMADMIDVDVLVVSGMVCCEEFVKTEGPVLLKAAKRGVKVLLHGCGQLDFSERETAVFGEFLTQLKPLAFVTRDDQTFDNLGGFCQNSFSGIDCAFFLSDAFDPAPMLAKGYLVSNFDAGKEPRIETDRKIFRAHHMCTDAVKPGWYKEKDVLISDIPEDYLNLYAGSSEVHSDRVHACIAGLNFDCAVKLYSDTPRASLFAKVGCPDVQNTLVKLDRGLTEKLKQAQLDYLRSVL